MAAKTKFKDIEVGKFFIFLKEPFMRTTDGDGWSGDNAFNFLIGQPVAVDPYWDVVKTTYRQIVKRFFHKIIERSG